ncbi:LysR family transcriptional regulator [Micrococcus lylae]|uniref:LysR family transcriptional regulator n=1 Tax=Micrococcus lylae TaxID=1273 RepID=UPI003EC007F4
MKHTDLGRLPELDPSLVSAFLRTVEAGTVSEAARQLGVVQPALSRQLQRLERQTGLSLFARGGPRLRLTHTGEAFVPVARRLLAEHRAAGQAVQMLAAGRLESVRFAAPGTTLVDVVIPFVATLSEDAPRAEVVETDLDDSLAQAVAHHDLVVMPSTPPDTVASLALVDAPVWAYVAPHHRWAGRGRISVDDLTGERLVVPSRSFKSRRVLDGALEVAGLTVPEVTEVNSGRVAQALVATGAGVAVVTEDPAFDLVPLHLAARGADLAVGLHAAWAPDHYGEATLRALAQQLQGWLRDRYRG